MVTGYPAEVATITELRNKIAHDADLLDGDLKHRRPITDADVTDAIDWIERPDRFARQ